MYQSLALVTGGLLYETARRQASQLIPIIESRFQPDQVTIVRNQRIPTQVINLDDPIIELTPTLSAWTRPFLFSPIKSFTTHF